MKKLITLFMLLCMVCTGAWADQFTIDISAGTIKNNGGATVTTGYAAKWESTQTSPFQISIVAYNASNSVVNNIHTNNCTNGIFQIAAGLSRPGYFVISANNGYKITHCSFTASAENASNTVKLSLDGTNYELPPTTGKEYSFDCLGTAKIWMNTENQHINFTNIVLSVERVHDGGVYTIKSHFNDGNGPYLYNTGSSFGIGTDISNVGNGKYWVARATGDNSYPYAFESGYGDGKYLSGKTGLETTAQGFTFNTQSYLELKGNTNDGVKNIGTWKNGNGFGTYGTSCYSTDNHAGLNNNDSWTTYYDIEPADVKAYRVIVTNGNALEVQIDGYAGLTNVPNGGLVVVPTSKTLSEADFNTEGIQLTINEEEKTIQATYTVANYVNTSTAAAPQYYTIQNVRTRDNASKNNRAYVTADTYGNGCLKQSNTISVGSYWYFEDASANAGSVDLSVYQPVYIRSAKFGGYLTTDGTIDAAYTKTKPANEKQIYYLWKWDNASNPYNYLCVSNTAAKTSNGNGTRNSWADRNGNGQEINYYYSQDGGTHFAFQSADKTTVENLVKEYVLPTANAISDDYVGDYSPEDVPNLASAKVAYDIRQTSQTLNGLREAYTQEFNWATTAPARRAISTDKYYVIESAHTGFTTSGTYVLRASSDNANNKIRWGAYDSNDIKSVWRFDKLVEGATVNESAGNGWGSVNGTYNIYSLYNVGRQTEGFIGISTFGNPIEFKNSASLKDTYHPADNSHAAAFAVVPVEANSSKFNILCNYYTGEDTRENFTLAVSTDASVTATSGNATCRNAWGTTPSNPTLSQWKVREVSAPTAPTQNVAISSVGVATFYTGKTLEIPNGVTAKKVVDAENAQQGDVYHLVYEVLQDEIIPAGTAVVLFGDENPSYQFPRSLEPHDYVVTRAAGSEENRLIGTLASDVTATGKGQDGTLYALGNKDAGVAFYHFLGDTLTAGKAYLDASGIGVSGVRAFAIFDEGTGTVTHIDAITGETIGEGTAFDLAGRRVNANIKGISIINGKKVIR